MLLVDRTEGRTGRVVDRGIGEEIRDAGVRFVVTEAGDYKEPVIQRSVVNDAVDGAIFGIGSRVLREWQGSGIKVGVIVDRE